jgi:predicted GNAT family acetyltransferase
MNFKQDENRIFLTDPEGKTIAEVRIPEKEPGVRDIERTFVDDSLRGQGIADQLLHAVVDRLQQEGKKAIPSCSYAAKWFGNHPEHENLVNK